MSQPIKYIRTPLSVVCQFSLLVQGLGWMPSWGAGGANLKAQAQTPSNAIDNLGSFEPAPTVTATPEPEYSPPQVEWQPNPAPAAEAPSPYYAAEEQWAPEPAPSPYYAAEEQWAPEPAQEPYYAPQEQWQPAPAAAEPAPEPYYAAEEQWAPEPVDYSNVYIDPNDYSIGATTGNEAIAQDDSYDDSYQEPSAVVFSERSTGCETVLQSGQAASGNLCGAAATVSPPPPTPAPSNVPSNVPSNLNTGVEQYVYSQPQQQYQAPAPVQQYASPRQTQQYQAPAPQEYLPPVPVQQYYSSAAPEPQYYYDSPAYNAPAPSNGGMQPVQLGALSIGSNGVKYDVRKHAGELDRKRAARSQGRVGNGNTQMIFPLAVPAPITSLFGWRTHPITGGRNFHSGIDFGAPMGTPVLAAYAGQVAIADWLGGYGLTVVLEHTRGTAETLYGHLSELFVKEGEEVQQGDVIGLVGSTGNSTGPHLHFELRELTREGWVALDPGTQLEYAMAGLVDALSKPPSQLEVALSKAAKPLTKYAKSEFFNSLQMAGFQLPNQQLSSAEIDAADSPN